MTSRTTRIAVALAGASALALAGCGEQQPPQQSLQLPKPTTSTQSAAPSPTTTPSATQTQAQALTTRAAAPTRAARSATRPTVAVRTVTDTRGVDFTTIRRTNGDAPKGSVKVVRKGKAGQATVTKRQTVSGRKVIDTDIVKTQITREPVHRVIEVGTKVAVKPKAASKPTSKPSPRATQPRAEQPSTSGKGLNLARAGMWDRIAQCESTGNWSINTGNGYYGGLQFDIRTWLGAGGGDFAPRADLASRAEQITVANRVYADRGLQPWGCGHAA